MDNQSKNEFISKAKGLAKFFQLEIKLKLFGQVVWEWVFPPEK